MVLCIKNCRNAQINQNYDINNTYHPYLNASNFNQRNNPNNYNQTSNNFDRRLNLNINTLNSHHNNNVNVGGYTGNNDNYFDNMTFRVSNDNLNDFKINDEDRLPTYDELIKSNNNVDNDQNNQVV
jgi:hypothetical protein